MSAINRIPRGLMVLAMAVIVAVLVWRLAPNGFLYPSIGIAAAVVIILGFAIYLLPKARISSADYEPKGKKRRNKQSENESEKTRESIEDVMESEEMVMDPGLADDEPVSPSVQQQKARLLTLREFQHRPNAVDVAARYFKMAAAAKAQEEESVWKPKPTAVKAKVQEPLAGKEISEESVTGNVMLDEVDSEQSDEARAGEVAENGFLGGPAMPLINDETALTEEDKNQLENAVWYRCENPYCKYTRFLDVHHIMDEKDGGNNKLDNLIVLCPYCHDLAHKNEIPEKEMRDWINNRQDRFKFKPQWHY